jgi:hypothetical protein
MRTAVLWSVVALVACSTRPTTRASADDPAPPPETTRANVETNERAPALRIEVDGAEVARVAVASLADRVRLADVIASHAPQATWKVVEGVRADGYAYAFDAPAEPAEQELWLYLDPAGRPSLGSYLRSEVDASSAIKAKPRLGMPGIVAVRVRTVETSTPDRHADALRIRVEGTEAALDDEAFRALPELPSPSGGRSGRNLRDVVAARVPLDRVARVTLVGAGDDRRELAATALTDAGRVLFVKRNRQGLFRFEDWNTADGAPRRTTELRPLVAIEIATAE